jgi:RNA-directed DNA polymerase
MFHRERRYANRTHPQKSWYWKKQRYWGTLNLQRKDNWVFGDKQSGSYLLKFSWIDIRRHIMVRGTHSPDDPRLKEYWQDRNKKKVRDLPPRQQRIAKRQESLCEGCGETLFNGELLEVHHVRPKKDGGEDGIHNLHLLHLYCHQQITAHEQRT